MSRFGHPAAWGFWVAAAAAYVLLPSYSMLIAEIAALGLFALSLDLVLGYAGILSLGHAAFFGVGAYAAGIAARNGIEQPLVGLALAWAVASLIGLATSPLVLRGSDLTRLMVTLGVASILYEVANRLTWLTGGADGLQGMVVGPVLGMFEFDLEGRVAAAYCLAVAFLGFLVAQRLVHSSFGWSLRAIRGNPMRAAAIGVPVARRLIAAYTAGAGLAGIAGALLAQSTGFVSLDVLAFHRSADVMLVLVLGGVGWLGGGLVGAVVFKVLQDLLSAWTPQYWQFWIGALLVAIVLVGRERLGRLIPRFRPRAAPAE